VTYRAYGISHSSNVPLPALCVVPASEPDDLCLETTSEPPSFRTGTNQSTRFLRTKRHVRVLVDSPVTVTAFGSNGSYELAYANGTLLFLDGARKHVTPNWDKRYLDGVRATFEPQPKRLGVIYLLSPRTDGSDAPRIEEIAPRDALLALVQNTYMNWLPNRDRRAAEFDFLSKVLNQVPARRIIPPADPARLPALCDLIIADAMTLTAPNSARTSVPQPT